VQSSKHTALKQRNPKTKMKNPLLKKKESAISNNLQVRVQDEIVYTNQKRGQLMQVQTKMVHR
jgi:hypothetical protein